MKVQPSSDDRGSSTSRCEVIVRTHPVSRLKSSRSALLVLGLMAVFGCEPGSGQTDSWTDGELARYLMRNGVAVSVENAALWFDSGGLGPNQMDRFSKLVNGGIVYIEAYLGGSHRGSRKIQ